MKVTCKENIAILLCTYNGGKYIREQLNSILNQSYQDFQIFIHDDYSSDNTINIINEYKSLYGNKILLCEDDKHHRGAAESFMWLLNHVEAEYYMFCDQDDVWLQDKILKSYKKMISVEQLNPNKAILIHTDLKIVDEKLNILQPSMWKYAGFKVDISKKIDFLIFGNVVTGCTIIINKKAKGISLPFRQEFNVLHDFWIAINVAKYGIIENIKESTILYRQHDKNECGMGKKQDKLKIDYVQFYEWWNNIYPLLQYINYGSYLKLLYNRSLYFIYRHFL